MLEQPGTGEALRLQGLTGPHDTEVWAGAAVDWLEQRHDVDAPRVVIAGWSLGGYYAPAPPRSRSVSPVRGLGRQPRLGAVQRRRLEREGERPVPHYWEHVLWVWGFDGEDDGTLNRFIESADDVHLEGVVEQITVPFLPVRRRGEAAPRPLTSRRAGHNHLLVLLACLLKERGTRSG